MIVDFHNHLDLYPNPSKVVSECEKKSIYVLCMTTTPKAWSGTCRLVLGKKRIKVALGFHPQLAHSRQNDLVLFEKYLPQAKYVGEIGLDGSSDYKNYFDKQLKVFRHILSCVNAAGGRILSIHSKQCVDVVLTELKDIACIPVLHWFSGRQDELHRAIARGCWFSVGPQMLFSKRGRELVALMPRDRILTETDGPFSHVRGLPLYPWDVPMAFKQLGELWKIGDEDVNDIISENFLSLLKAVF